MRIHIVFGIICCLFAFFIPERSAHAQLVVTETQSLDFGTFVTRDFGRVSRVTVQPNNNTTYDADTIGLVPGQRAEYSVTGGPANTAFTVTIDSSTDPTLNGLGGENFRLDQFRVRPNTLQTNGAGADTFRIGARLRTNGGGAVYLDGTYLGSYDLTVAF